MATQQEENSVESSVLARFGFTKGLIIQEFYYDVDVDEPLRAAFASATGEALVDEDYGDVVDAVLLWFRKEDGDLADTLMDVQALLEDGGTVWVLTPVAGSDAHVDHRDVEEASSIAGLHATSTFVACNGWSATQLNEKGVKK